MTQALLDLSLRYRSLKVSISACVSAGGRFAMAAVIPVVKRPSIASRLPRAFSMPGQATKQAGCGTLMSIAVSPEAQGQGIGQMLVRAFLEEAACRDLRQVDLTTDRENNEATNRLYQRLGFVCKRTYSTPEGWAMNEYVIDLATLSWLSDSRDLLVP